MARYVSAIKDQLQHVADVLTTRYDKESRVADVALKTLADAALLERELLNVEEHLDGVQHLPFTEFSPPAIY
ncbi:MAG: hypothetical protein JO108_29295 [Acidobacteriaceae bacterium]|nr:hypothetical protein [Acidobacteriaceae bacterium]